MTREEAIDILSIDRLAYNETDADKFCEAYNMAIKALKQEPNTGHWIDTGSGQECSECGEIQYGYDNFRYFCANCGAEMKEGEKCDRN